MKTLISNHIVRPFKKFLYFGRLRFWILYWAYRITGWHIRHKEWDFVLEYLPKLHSKKQIVRVLDVGCSRNLLCHELVYRGYYLQGIDLEYPDFKYPSCFYQYDICDLEDFPTKYNFVICISVLEHIYDGDWVKQTIAVLNMIKSLKVGGRLILTIPTHEFASGGHPWHGFSLSEIENLLPYYAKIIEYTEKAGQICCVIERTA